MHIVSMFTVVTLCDWHYLLFHCDLISNESGGSKILYSMEVSLRKIKSIGVILRNWSILKLWMY